MQYYALTIGERRNFAVVNKGEVRKIRRLGLDCESPTSELQVAGQKNPSYLQPHLINFQGTLLYINYDGDHTTK
jgi:hypothetical protein